MLESIRRLSVHLSNLFSRTRLLVKPTSGLAVRPSHFRHWLLFIRITCSNSRCNNITFTNSSSTFICIKDKCNILNSSSNNNISSIRTLPMLSNTSKFSNSNKRSRYIRSGSFQTVHPHMVNPQEQQQPFIRAGPPIQQQQKKTTVTRSPAAIAWVGINGPGRHLTFFSLYLRHPR